MRNGGEGDLTLADLQPPLLPTDRPINEAEVKTLATLALNRAERDHPGDAHYLERLLRLVYRRWADDWVTSEMGGGGGTGIQVEDGCLHFYWASDPLSSWDVKLGYVGREWRSIEWSDPDEDDEVIGVVDAFMAGLDFHHTNAHRWPRKSGPPR